MIKVSVTMKSALCSKTYGEYITSGEVGKEVEFDFSDDWSGYSKTAVFEGSGVAKDRLLTGDSCTIPPECIVVPGSVLKCGIYGVRGDLVTPTIYCEIGKITRGADPSGDESTDPSPPVWAQLWQQIGDIDDLNTEDKSSLVAAINEAISKGASPESIIAIVVKYLEENPVTVKETDPTVPAWAKAEKKPAYTAEEVGADPEGTAANAVNQHNVDDGSHNDIRAELKALNERLTAFFDSDDQTLDELSEIVGNIKSNKTLIDSITTSKVSVADIINNLVTNVSNKPLSAAQGVALKALIDAIVVPTKLSQLTNDSNFITASGAPVQSVNGKTGAVNLNAASVGARPDNWMPTAQDVGALPNTYTPPNQTAAQVGADPAGTAESKVSAHNTEKDAHNDIRLLITGLTNRLDALANSYDITLDQMVEVVACIKANRDLIEQITTGKVSVSDIIDNLTTNVANKPLSAAQGVALKALIDAITVPTKMSQLANDAGFITSYVETDPTVPAWAKATTKPSYSKSEVGLGNVENVKQYSASNPPPYPVTSVNGNTGAVTLDASAVGARPSNWMPTASEVGALPASTTIPSKTSQLTNDSGYIKGYTETDPTVPSWAKAASKPSYSKSEVGLGNVDNVKQYSASNPPPYPVTSVNGKTGAVTVSVPTKVSQLQNDSGFLTEISKEEIVQQVIAALGTPVFGRVDADNNIILTGELADGAYVVKYEDETGTVTTIGNLTQGVTYTNVLALATDESGNVLNGVGYKVGYRVSSYSGDLDQDQGDTTGFFATGFMPYSVVQSRQKVPIYIKGVSLDLTALPNYLRFTHCIPGSTEWVGICQLNKEEALNNFTVTQLGDNYFKFTPNANLNTFNGWYSKDLTHMRWSLPGNGAGVIITINEPIE